MSAPANAARAADAPAYGASPADASAPEAASPDAPSPDAPSPDAPEADVPAAETRATPAPFAFEVVTAVADAWGQWLGPKTGLVGRAFASGRASVQVSCLRAHGLGRHRNIDAASYGGGAGMVLAPGPLHAAMQAARARTPGPVVLLSPRGTPLRQSLLRQWAQGPGLTLVCGRYEGIDERAYRYADAVVSAGDFVLSGGDPAALCIIDGVTRLLPGVLGNEASVADESFEAGLLEYPQYTRPPTYDGCAVPAVLCGGDHAAIDKFRAQASVSLTRVHRPDLYALWAQKSGL